MPWNVRDLLLLMSKDGSHITLNLPVLRWCKIEVMVTLILQLIIRETGPSRHLISVWWLLIDNLSRYLSLLLAANRSGLKVLTPLWAEAASYIRLSAERSSLRQVMELGNLLLFISLRQLCVLSP